MRSFVRLSCGIAVLSCACGESSSGSARDAGLVDGATLDAPSSRDSAADPDGSAPSDATTVGDTSAPADASDSGAAPNAAPIFGVTITDPWVADRGVLGPRLAGLVGVGGRRPTARVVFDEGVDLVLSRDGATAADYVEPVEIIAADAHVMGEILDSFYVPNYDVGQLRARACEYRATLGHLVDIWEVGNEVNGEWLLAEGEPATAVVEKIVAVVEVLEADGTTFTSRCPGFVLRPDERPFELALTAYGNGGVGEPSCWERPEHQMTTWLTTHFGAGGRGAAVRDAFDLVLVSYYEDDCEGIQPAWQSVFDEIGALFPRARLGIGECGTTTVADKPRYVERYYAGMDSSEAAFANMHVAHPRFVGGFFWWYFSDDLALPAAYDAMRASLAGPFWSR